MSDFGETRKSKSQRKREALALQALGESLIALPASDLARIALWPDLEAAVAAGRGLERSALRRQIRYVARVLREGDAGAVAQALDSVRRSGRREAARHRRIERLRDALMRGETSLDDIRAVAPGLDFQQLRRLVAAAQRERDGGPGGTSARRLFRFLRDRGLGDADASCGDGQVESPRDEGE